MAASSRRATGAGDRETYRHHFAPTRALPMQCLLSALDARRGQREVMAQQYPHRVGDHGQMQLNLH